MNKKQLILRLSSLGDVILASAALEAVPAGGILDWLVAREWGELIQDHPKINEIHAFDRSVGIKGWIHLCRKLWESEYENVFDLHQSLRTRMMRVLFIFWGLTEGKPKPQWKSVSKQRFRLYSYYVFKSLWPKAWRPTPWVRRYAQRVGGSGEERPNLIHLIQSQNAPSEIDLILEKSSLRGYLCIMPSSRWDGKKWPVEHYLEVVKKTPYFPVILGTQNDLQSLELTQKLQALKIDHFSGVGKWNLIQTAFILKQSQGYLGGDTGLAHLAEAIGVSARIIFGPTTPEMGFGPWRKESKSLGLSLWCRPCGKDGQNCYRISQKHLCLKALSAEKILEKF